MTAHCFCCGSVFAHDCKLGSIFIQTKKLTTESVFSTPILYYLRPGEQRTAVQGLGRPCVGIGPCPRPPRQPLRRMRDRRHRKIGRVLPGVQPALPPPMRGVRGPLQRGTPARLGFEPTAPVELGARPTRASTYSSGGKTKSCMAGEGSARCASTARLRSRPPYVASERCQHCGVQVHGACIARCPRSTDGT